MAAERKVKVAVEEDVAQEIQAQAVVAKERGAATSAPAISAERLATLREIVTPRSMSTRRMKRRTRLNLMKKKRLEDFGSQRLMKNATEDEAKGAR